MAGASSQVTRIQSESERRAAAALASHAAFCSVDSRSCTMACASPSVRGRATLLRHRHTACIVAWWERRTEERVKYDDGRTGAEAAARHRQRLAALGRELVACGALDKQQFEKWNNRRAARHA